VNGTAPSGILQVDLPKVRSPARQIQVLRRNMQS